jgi:hypothetical protein
LKDFRVFLFGEQVDLEIKMATTFSDKRLPVLRNKRKSRENSLPVLFLKLCSRAESIKSAPARLSVVHQWFLSDNREVERKEITVE